MRFQRRRNGFYIGAFVGFFGRFINESRLSDPKDTSFVEILFDSALYSLACGILLFVGVVGLAGRAHSDKG
ncbi:hypothetical protein [Rheinheimera sp. 1928-s]|uniref:hypothetical protein n=1 Tax=Rheinheimera sp. 1928-s TaxID=3033803 RepID=UPI00261A6467|nr:hypothetical protein [Rheinheimera sp. 1928-s]MDF3126295.1 hypothetical protein [Rheinheimera sp. 1928-s]